MSSSSKSTISEPSPDQIASRSCCAAVRAVLYHLIDVGGGALLLVKQPASALLALLIFGSIMSFVISVVFARARAGVAHLCEWPLLSTLDACAPLAPPPSPVHVDFPSLVAVQHHALHEFLGYSDNGSELAINLKHAELAVQDLIVLVKASDLTIKDALADALMEFVVDAKAAGRGLQLLSAKINGAMDNIIAYNQYALHTLRSTQGSKKTAFEALIASTFQASMETFAAEITRVLVHTTATSVTLDRLEERLLAMHTLCTQEALMTAFALEDLLWQLWTQLGGNRKQRRDLENRAMVLRSVQRYRSLAMAFVGATAQTLTAVDAELMELRERLSASGLLPEVTPIEVQIARIQLSVMRLKDEKMQRRSGVPELPDGMIG